MEPKKNMSIVMRECRSTLPRRFGAEQTTIPSGVTFWSPTLGITALSRPAPTVLMFPVPTGYGQERRPVAATPTRRKRSAASGAANQTQPSRRKRSAASGAANLTSAGGVDDVMVIDLTSPGSSPRPVSQSAAPPGPGLNVWADDAAEGTVHVTVDRFADYAPLLEVEMSLHWLSQNDGEREVWLHSGAPCRHQANELPVRVTFIEFPPRRTYYVMVYGLLEDGRGWTRYKVEQLPASQHATCW